MTKTPHLTRCLYSTTSQKPTRVNDCWPTSSRVLVHLFVGARLFYSSPHCLPKESYLDWVMSFKACASALRHGVGAAMSAPRPGDKGAYISLHVGKLCQLIHSGCGYVRWRGFICRSSSIGSSGTSAPLRFLRMNSNAHNRFVLLTSIGL